MGNQLAAPPKESVLSLLQSDVPDVSHKDMLFNGRFLKSYQCLHDEGCVVVKVFLKRELSLSLAEEEAKIKDIIARLPPGRTPNVLPYQRVLETERAAYLIRQFQYSNLYDRISTRPFLSPTEKRWIAFQLLCALKQSHGAGVVHGDIKSSNVLLTTWTWVFLSDFASYKPVTLREDNPADFSYYFDTSGRRTCYIAPERFCVATGPVPTSLTPSMDIFSMGCVIAELFLDGEPLFDLSKLVRYKKGEYDPTSFLKERISDPEVVALVQSMIKLDPLERYTAQICLDNWTSSVFPAQFSTYLHPLMVRMLPLGPDERVREVQVRCEELLLMLRYTATASTSASPSPSVLQASSGASVASPPPMALPSPSSQPRKTSISAPQTPSAESQISDLLLSAQRFLTEHQQRAAAQPTPKPVSQSEVDAAASAAAATAAALAAASMPAHQPTPRPPLWPKTQAASPDAHGLIVIVDLLCACLRSLRSSQSKLITLELLLHFSPLLHPEHLLERVVPYTISMLSDTAALVRASAISGLAQLLQNVSTLSLSDANLFPEYVLPSVSLLHKDPEELVRATYASNIGNLAETARKFLELSQFVKRNAMVGGDTETVHKSDYDADLKRLQDSFFGIVAEMLIDRSSVVKRTLLEDITRVCTFFGQKMTTELVLPLLITFLNDKDWEVRCAFVQNLVGVSAFVGSLNLEFFIFPCMMQALADEEELVLVATLNCFASLAELRLFRHPTLMELVRKLVPLHWHPNPFVRTAVIGVTSAVASTLDIVQLHVDLLPLIQPLLTIPVTHLSAPVLAHALSPPVSRQNFLEATKTVAASRRNSRESEDASRRSSTLSDAGTQHPSRSLPIQRGLARQDSKALSVRASPSSSPPSPSASFADAPLQVPAHLSTAAATAIAAAAGASGAKATPPKRKRLPRGPATEPPPLDAAVITGVQGLNLSSGSGVPGETTPPPHSGGPEAGTPSELSRLTLAAFSRSGIALTGKSPSSALTAAMMQDEAKLSTMQLFLGAASSAMQGRLFQATSDREADEMAPYESLASTLPLHTVALSNPHPVTRTFSGNYDATTPQSAAPAKKPTDEWKYFFGERKTRAPSVRSSTFSPVTPPLPSPLAPVTSIANEISPPGTSLTLSPSLPHMSLTGESLAPLALIHSQSVRRGSGGHATSGIDILLSESNEMSRHIVQRRAELRMPLPDPELGMLSRDALSVAPLSPSSSSMSLVGVASSVPGTAAAVAMASARQSSTRWRPKGVLVGHFQEHKGAVNAIRIASDNSFFATGSNDGTVKIWDCQRLEKNVTSRAQMTYASQGGRITSLAICEGSHSVVSGSSNGSVHVFRVEFVPKPDLAANRYTGMSEVYKKDALEPEAGGILCVQQYATDTQTIVAFSTQNCKICGWDLRAQRLAFELHQPVHFGAVSTFVVGHCRAWLLAGSVRGFLTLWDLRFGVLVRAWRHPSGGAIHRIQNYPSSTDRPLVLISAAGAEQQMSLWDLATSSCRLLLRTTEGNTPPEPPSVVPTKVSLTARAPNNGVDELRTGTEYDTAARTAVVSPDCSWIITGGADKRLRYWDLNSVADSFVVSGQLQSRTVRFASTTYDQLLVLQEVVSKPVSTSRTSAAQAPSRSVHSAAASGGGSGAAQPSFSEVGTRTADGMSHAHRDCILDTGIIDTAGHVTLLSCCRDGIVKAWK